MYKDEIAQVCKDIGTSKVGIISTKDIDFNEQLRESCAANLCGRYNTNWTCPPGVGEFEMLVKRALEYEYAVVFQNIYQLEDSFDFENMERGNELHYKMVKKVAEQSKKICKNALILGAGGCRECQKCAFISNEPCRFPDIAISSMEAYGMYVSNIAGKSGMEYINGENTVTYFGMVLC